MFWQRSINRPSEPKAAQPLFRCSFCNKNQRNVKKLIAGPRVFICDECVGICNQILAEDRILVPAREPEGPEPVEPSVLCSVCGLLAPVSSGLNVPERGVICASCVAAIQDASKEARRP